MIDVLSYRQWAISQQFANTFGLMALKLLSEGKSIEHLIKKHSHEDLRQRYDALVSQADGIVVSTEWDRESRLEIATTKHGQNVAIVPVLGALTKRGDLCSYGMRDYIGMIDRANKSQKISAIVLDIESPGGTVDGTNEFGLAVKNSKKPVVAFGDGMVASAAYWVASQARQIVANKNNATEFGSIGVLYIHENYQAYIQKEIGAVEIIRAPQSVDKARVNVIEPITDDQRSDIRLELKEIAKEFISTVKKGRGAKLNTGDENIFTGKMYPSSDAITMGMIDALDTLQGAINRAGQLAINPSTSTASAKAEVNRTMKFKSKLLSAFFGKSEKAEEQPAAENQDQASMEAADKKAAELEAENEQLKADKESQSKKIGELEQNVTDLKGQVSTLEGENKKLTEEKSKLENEKTTLQTKIDAMPNAPVTTVIASEKSEASQASDQGAVKEGHKYLTSVDAEAAKIREQQKSQPQPK